MLKQESMREENNSKEIQKPFDPNATDEFPVLDSKKEMEILDNLKKEYQELLLVERRTEEQQKRFKIVQSIIESNKEK